MSEVNVSEARNAEPVNGAAAALASLINPEALRQIIVEAARRGDVKVSIPADIVKRILGDQCEAAAKVVSERVAEMAMDIAKKIARNVKINVPGREAVVLKNPHKQTVQLYKLLETLRPKMRNVLLVGPAGSGKTTACDQVAQAAGFTNAIIKGQVLTRFEFDGFVDGHGVYHSTEWRQFCESANGGVYVQDEIDSCEPSALLSLKSYLSTGRITFPDGKSFTRTDRHWIVANANTFGNGADRMYCGRNQLDAATLDEYRTFIWEYDEELESQLVANEAWHAKVKSVRRAVESLKLRHTVTPRDAMRGADEIAGGSDVEEQTIAQLKRGMPAADWAKVIANLKN